MKRSVIIWALSGWVSAAGAAGSVTVPWEEFEALYKARIDSERISPANKPFIASIDTADYEINIDHREVHGQVRLSGTVIQGNPAPIRLFGQDVTVTAVNSMTSGSLFGDTSGYQLHLHEGAQSFSLSVDFSLAPNEDQRARFVEFNPPAALLSSVAITTPDTLRVIDVPGLTLVGDRYHSAAGQPVRIYFDAKASDFDAGPMVDTVTVVQKQGSRLVATSYFAPLRPVNAPLEVELPSGQYQQSSLKRSWVRPEPATDRLIITLPSEWQQTFSISYDFPLKPELQIPLVAITGNRGREGDFVIAQPSDGKITITNDSLLEDLDLTGLAKALHLSLALEQSFSRLTKAEPLHLTVAKFDLVEQPEQVLDTIHLYAQYSDNGTALTMLSMALPANSGPLLRIKPIENAEIWSLMVNGEPRRLLAESNNDWVIPLDSDASLVELSYVIKGPKLTLNGRLELTMPATGLAAKALNITVALNGRFELIAVEGDLEPANDHGWPKKSPAADQRYHFTYPFYRGGVVNAAIFYQEPIDSGAS